MSKSLGNYVGITEPPEEMFGKLMSIPDDAMGEYSRLLLSAEELDPEHPAAAKRDLARRLVERFHGAEAAGAAEQRFDRIHVERRPPEDIEEIAVGDDGPVHVPALLADHFGLSRSEGRRLIEQGGVRVGGRVLQAGELDLAASELDGEIVQVGKRRFARLRVAR
jgi:tyrosyl-tRNA synthetase